LVGLIATDGCLINNGRAAVITAKDKKFLMKIRGALGFQCGIRRKRGFSGTFGYDLRIGRKLFYTKLLQIGLTPRKSLTIGKLDVPDAGLGDFLRGVIDGDGNIRRWKHPSNNREQWAVRIVSASIPFLQ